MKRYTFVSSNKEKARYLTLWLGLPIDYKNAELPELQSLDLKEVVTFKAKQAYTLVQKPVIVEDVGFVIKAMGNLPGPLVKWFIEEIGATGLSRLAQTFGDTSARAEIVYAVYDGHTINYFYGSFEGTVSDTPKGKSSFGWNPIFVPAGSKKTYAEMSDDELQEFSHRAKAIKGLRSYLRNA